MIPRDFDISWEILAPVLCDLNCALTRQHEERLRRQELGETESLIDWGQRFLPRHFQRTPSRMHVWLAEQFDTVFPNRGVKMNVLAPRGSAKSTLGTLAYPPRIRGNKNDSHRHSFHHYDRRCDRKLLKKWKGKEARGGW